MFGLGQLYQLRGRVGRSKVRAYALFTRAGQPQLHRQAGRRLKVLQSLDTLGAGFQLASHDLDIRGAGNLLGEEQSGHIKEVGYELYQEMLDEAVEALKARHRGAGRGAVVALDHARHAGDDPRELCRRSAAAPRPLPAPLGAARPTQEIESFARRDDRPLRPAAGGGRAAARSWWRSRRLCRRAQCRKGRCGAEGRHRRRSATIPSPIRKAWSLYRRTRLLREGAAGHENRVHPRCSRMPTSASRRRPQSCATWWD